MINTFFANLSHYVPELTVIVIMVGALFLEAGGEKQRRERRYTFFLGIIGLIFCLFSLVKNISLPPTPIFTNAVVIDSFSTMMKIIMTLGALGSFYVAIVSKDIKEDLKSEFIILSSGVLVGGMLLASANNLLAIYLGVEMLSILSYVLASLNRNDEKSTEGGIKYAIYGGITSGIMLFGMSHIYGVLGSIQFSEIINIVQDLNRSQMLVLLPSFLFVFAGLGYKVACVPFHMWSPDVYQGSPLPVTTFFAIVPKIAGIAVIVRTTNVFFKEPGILQDSWIGLFQIIIALTITVGNILAIDQKSVKRMLAYSSISHMGFILLGVLLFDKVGISALVFYSITYLFMTLGAFAITSFLSDEFRKDNFSIFNGLMRRHPTVAIIMTIIMFSLGGLPPFAGFVAKYHILSATVKGGFYFLAIIAALNSVISLYYYLRIVRAMIFKDFLKKEKSRELIFINQFVLLLICVPVVFLGIFWEKIMMITIDSNLLIK